MNKDIIVVQVRRNKDILIFGVILLSIILFTEFISGDESIKADIMFGAMDLIATLLSLVLLMKA